MATVMRGIAHLIICALAGTGKTTVLVQLVRIFAGKGLMVLCLAFARRDKAALEKRTNGKAKVMTSHGGGLSILSTWARSQGFRLEVNDDIPNRMLEQRWIEDGLIIPGAGEGGRNKWEESVGVWSAILSLVGKARTCLALKANDARFKRCPTESDWCELADRFDLELASDDLPNVLFYSAWLFTELASLNNVRVWGVDPDGMVFLPVYHDLKPTTTYDVVLVDETQDQSFVTRSIAFAFLRPNTGRIVAVGDENQAIYGWRGADSLAMGEMAKMMEEHANAPEYFPLTLCRRCAKAIIREAQCIVPAIQALPDAPEGEVANLDNGEALFDTLKIERKGLVLCRANAPLVSMALRLLAARIPAALMRSNIVGDLLRMIDTLSQRNATMAVTDLLEKVEEWLTDRLAKLAKRKNGAAAAQVASDKAACLRALAEEETVKTAGDLKRKIDELFPHDPSGETVNPAKLVVFSTVHGAKGGEAHTVYLYSPDGLKANIFDQVWSDATDRDNTLYVALTRAEFRLVYVGGKPTLTRFSEGMEGDEE